MAWAPECLFLGAEGSGGWRFPCGPLATFGRPLLSLGVGVLGGSTCRSVFEELTVLTQKPGCQCAAVWILLQKPHGWSASLSLSLYKWPPALHSPIQTCKIRLFCVWTLIGLYLSLVVLTTLLPQPFSYWQLWRTAEADRERHSPALDLIAEQCLMGIDIHSPL